MILIGVFGLSVILVVVALRLMSRDRGPGRYLAISTVPMLLTTVVPVPFVLSPGGSTGWARMTVEALSVVGIVLSFVLFAIGAVLTVRAARAGDRRATVLLGLQTALAGLPAGIVTASATLLRLM